MSDVVDLFASMVRRKEIPQGRLIGCIDGEIESVERHFNGTLPSAYRDFLTIAGKGAGKLFQGTDIFYPKVLELQSAANDLLMELDVAGLLPQDAKVFCMHQGYEINYFLPDLDDPPVFQFFEGQKSVSQPWNSFSEFLRYEVERHLTQWPDLA